MTLTTNRNMYPSFSHLFDDFFSTEMGDWRRNNFSSSNTTLPKVNISEDGDRFSVEMAAPGMEKEHFKIDLDRNVLTISSENELTESDTDVKYSRREFAYHAFQRSFTLPNTVDSEQISASYENGILNVTIPKKEEAKPKPPKTIAIA